MPEVLFGRGTLERRFAEASSQGWIVLCGGSSFELSGAREILRPFLEGVEAIQIVEGPLPNVQEVDEIARKLGGLQISGVVSVGGGLVLDTAKVVALCLATGHRVDELLAGGDWAGTASQVDTVAVPTTAGAGSERTPFAVMYQRGIKHSVDDPRLLPRSVVVDPMLMESVPAPVAAAAGLDAMAHCIESLWATGSTTASRALAAEALRTIVEHIEPAVLGGRATALDAMAMAASDAGGAIATTRTTAAHALSYYLTSRHGIAHGHAVALTLGSLIELNEGVAEQTCNDPRGADHVKRTVNEICSLLGVDDGRTAREVLEGLVGRLGLATTVDEAAHTAVDRAAWVAEVNTQRLSNNPRLLTPADLDEIARLA